VNRALRSEYLAAMGLETWVVRATPPVAGGPDVSAALAAQLDAVLPGAARPVAASPGVARPVAAPPGAARPLTAGSAAALSSPAIPPRAAMSKVPADGAPQNVEREAAYDWAQLRERVAACTRCGLSGTRTQTVFGVGSPTAEWLVVGEAPGAEEDRQGEPFVGRAGQLLNSMLRAIGLAREQVYIANVLKCRPPHNRDPLPGEITECLPYLERQIALLKPKIMLVVGRIAAQNLLRTDAPLGRLRQQVHIFGASRVPLVVTYHPAYLLRAPMEKRKTWEDLKFAREVSVRG
jgi:uracil-DNA glycosylase